MIKQLLAILLLCAGVTSFGQYQVGDVGPAGGWVFHVDDNDEFESWDYLEVWPHTYSYFKIASCDYSPYLSSDTLGSGEGNTSYFAYDDDNFTTFDFAVLFDGGGRKDWFVPSKSELEVLNASVVSELINSGEGYTVASSSVYNACQWWVCDNNACFIGTHDSWVRVLPIRSFKESDQGTQCGEGTVWDEVSQTCIIDETFCSWQPDSDGDQLIGVSDLLMFLSVFGDTDLDQDGIFDSNDDCVGEYDECGVCNGSGPSIPIIESIEILYDSLYAEQIDEWWVFQIGVDTTYSVICGYGCTDEAAENYDPSADTDDGSCLYPWACGDPLEYHGYDYETVQIGEQCWFAENLRSENYSNGEPINSSSDEFAISIGQGTGGCVGFVGGVSCSATEDFGKHYSGSVVGNSLSVCPNGWHIPTDLEWSECETSLGLVDANQLGWRGTHAKKMRLNEDWYGAWPTNDNSSGFTALAGGVFIEDTFYNAGQAGYWWSSTLESSEYYYRAMVSDYESVARQRFSLGYALSIRCIKD